MDYNGVGALRGQQHILRKNVTLSQVPPPANLRGLRLFCSHLNPEYREE